MVLNLLKELVFFLCASDIEDVHFTTAVSSASKLYDLQLFIQLIVDENFTCHETHAA